MGRMVVKLICLVVLYAEDSIFSAIYHLFSLPVAFKLPFCTITIWLVGSVSVASVRFFVLVFTLPLLLASHQSDDFYDSFARTR